MVKDRAYKPERILVFRIGQLGDTIAALPAFWMLREEFSSASLTLLTNSAIDRPGSVAASDVLPQIGLFDSVIDYPIDKKGVSALVSRVSLVKKLRKEKFDRVYYLMTRNRTKAQISRDVKFFKLAGINEVLGIDFLNERLLSFPIPVPTPEVSSESDFLIEMVRSFGVQTVARDGNLLRLSDNERRSAAEWMTANGVQAEGPAIIAVAPGSNWRSKIWAEDRFESVITQLIDQFSVIPIVVGGPQEQAIGERLIAKWKRGTSAAGQLTVRQSAALLENCDLYLGNDTGTMHLAAAVGTPCVAIFAAVDWVGRWAPFGRTGNRLFRARLDCEGCHLQNCPYGNRCLELVSIEDVHAACEDLLYGRPDLNNRRTPKLTNHSQAFI